MHLDRAGKIGLAAIVVGSTLLPTTANATDAATTDIAINFDTGAAPCSFRATSPLRDQYAKLGVQFGYEGKGGKVLNQCAHLHEDGAHSGRQYLALNAAKADITYQRISFTTMQRHMSLWVLEGRDGPDDGGGPTEWSITPLRDGRYVSGGVSTVDERRDWQNTQIDVLEGFDAVDIVCYDCTGSFLIDDIKLRT